MKIVANYLLFYKKAYTYRLVIVEMSIFLYMNKEKYRARPTHQHHIASDAKAKTTEVQYRDGAYTSTSYNQAY